MTYAQWNPQQNYLTGDSVYDGASAYTAVVGNTAQQPSLNTPAIWTVISSGGGGVPSVNAQTGPITLEGATDVISVTTVAPNTLEFALENTGVVAGTYTLATVEVNEDGRIVSASDGVPSGGGVPSVNAQTGPIIIQGSGLVTVTNPALDVIDINVPGLPAVVDSLNTQTGPLTLTGSGLATITSPSPGTLDVNVPALPPLVDSLEGLSGALSIVGAGGLTVGAAGSTITLTQGAAPPLIATEAVNFVSTIPLSNAVNPVYSFTITPPATGFITVNVSAMVGINNNLNVDTSLAIRIGGVVVSTINQTSRNLSGGQFSIPVSGAGPSVVGVPILVEILAYNDQVTVGDTAFLSVYGSIIAL